MLFVTSFVTLMGVYNNIQAIKQEFQAKTAPFCIAKAPPSYNLYNIFIAVDYLQQHMSSIYYRITNGMGGPVVCDSCALIKLFWKQVVYR